MASVNLDFTKLGSNIRSLRESYGETQLDLAFAVGLNSSGAIANYENGDRIPTRDILIKIAKHYQVTESELIHCDYSKLERICDYPLHDKSFNKAILEKMVPFVCSDEALADDNFKKAFELHTKLFNFVIQGDEFDPEIVNECAMLYDAARRNGIIEATANLLWFIIFEGIFTVLLTPQLMDNSDKVQSPNATFQDYLSLGYLPEFGEGAVKEYVEAHEHSRIEYLEANEDDMNLYMRQLKNTKKYAHLADHYLALRYRFNLITNSLTSELNKAIGEEMLVAFSTLGNPYAQKFLSPTPRTE